MSTTARNFFTPGQKKDIQQAILNAELDTSGEIRVHIENTCTGDIFDRASYLFKELNIHKTERRNGVLFYLAVKDRKFAILGDKGINKVVTDDFWDDIRKILRDNFRDGEFTKGLVDGITLVGTKLKKHYPYQTGDINELPDEISFGEEWKNGKQKRT